MGGAKLHFDFILLPFTLFIYHLNSDAGGSEYTVNKGYQCLKFSGVIIAVTVLLFPSSTMKTPAACC
jgi:hypothetical protein